MAETAARPAQHAPAKTIPVPSSKTVVSQGAWPIDGLEINAATYGGNGGNPWQESASIVCKGPITKVDVRADNEVRGLRFYYGQSGIGEWHGAIDGNPVQTWSVPAGEQIVRVEGRSGDKLDAIRFFTDKGSSSPFFGGNGGNPFQEEASQNGTLYAVSGRSGDSIDQVALHFGWPFVVKNVTFDAATISNPGSALQTKPLDFSIQEISNNTSIDQTVTYTKSVAATRQSTFSWQAGQSFTQYSSLTIGDPKIAGATISEEATVYFKEGQSTTNTETKTLTWTLPVKVPKGKRVTVTLSAKQYNMTLPYTYNVVWYRNNDPNNVVKEVTFAGTYEGVDFSDTTYSFIESSI
jgi:hypothetical protein